MRDITLVGLHHLQKGRVGDALACYGFGSSRLEPVSVRNASSQGLMGFSVNADNKLLFSVNDTLGSTKAGVSLIRLGKLIGERTDVLEFTVGMRIDTAYNSSGSVGYPLVGLYDTVPVMGSSVAPTYSLLAIATTSVAIASGYYEFQFTLAPTGSSGGKIDIYLDKVFVRTISLNSNWGRGVVKDLYLSFGRVGVACYSGTGVGLGGLGTTLFTAEDIYCLYDTSVADGSTRKGPMKIKPLEVAVNTDTAWVTSDGTAREAVLNLPDHHGTVLTPYITSPADASPMKLKRVTTPIASTDTIVAVSGATSASRLAGDAASLSAKWRFNGVDSAAVTYLPTTGDYTTQKDVGLPALMSMPDGTPITKAKLADLEMVLTPV